MGYYATDAQLKAALEPHINQMFLTTLLALDAPGTAARINVLKLLKSHPLARRNASQAGSLARLVGQFQDAFMAYCMDVKNVNPMPTILQSPAKDELEFNAKNILRQMPPLLVARICDATLTQKQLDNGGSVIRALMEEEDKAAADGIPDKEQSIVI